MRILCISAELSPLCQSGGLGEAVSALSRGLARRGHDVICAVPAYRQALAHPACPPLHAFSDVRVALPAAAGGDRQGRFWEGPLFPGVTAMLFDDAALFDRGGLYGDAGGLYADQALRFATFARASAYLAEILQPDVVIAHDWHAALSIATLRTNLDRGTNRGIGAVMVVHNNAYQGEFAPDAFALCGLPTELFHPECAEAWGRLNLLKLGLSFADRIVLVSPSYAREVQTPAFGEGLEGVYHARRHRMCGIANGIDVERYDPASDPALIVGYDAGDLSGKAQCRAQLLAEMGLDAPPAGLLLGAVGRFAAQKGWDVLASSLQACVQEGASVVLLGDGDPRIEEGLRAAARAWPGRVGLRVGFDDGLARRIYAGCDAILVPSRFEPCGLVQLIAHRYGALPIAHAVGGLRDTIACVREAGHLDWSRSTGVLFSPLSGESLHQAVREVAALGRSGALADVQRRLMSLDVSWAGPAERYEAELMRVRQEARARA